MRILKKKCHARVHTDGTKLVYRWKNHVSNVGEARLVEAAVVKAAFKRSASTSICAPKVVECRLPHNGFSERTRIVVHHLKSEMECAQSSSGRCQVKLPAHRRDISTVVKDLNRAFCDTVMKFGTVLFKTPYNNFRCGARFARIAKTPGGVRTPKTVHFVIQS